MSLRRFPRPRAALLPALALLACGAGVTAAAEPARLALVIGQATYAQPPALPACAEAASQAGAALARLGYRVTLVRDVTLGQLAASIAGFGRALSAAPEAQAVAYLCGQLVQAEGRAFLLPVSARVERPADAISQGLLARGLAQAVLRPGAPAGLLLIDAPSGPPEAPAMARALAGATGGAAIATTAAPALAEALAGLAAEGREATPGPLLTGLAARLAGRREVALVPHAVAEIPPPPAPVILPGPVPEAPPEPPPPAPEAEELPLPLPPPRPQAPAASPAATGEPALNTAQRRFIQSVLARLGYYGGAANGSFGASTRAAIRRYQQASGEPQTGLLSPAQARRLLFTMRQAPPA